MKPDHLHIQGVVSAPCQHPTPTGDRCGSLIHIHLPHPTSMEDVLWMLDDRENRCDHHRALYLAMMAREANQDDQ